MSGAENGNARQKILDSAEALFHAQGFSAISMRDIAGAVGIKQASLYYHFPNGKEQLFVAVAERRFERHRAGLQQTIDRAESSLPARLQAASNWFASQPPLNMLSMMHADMPVLSEAHKQQLLQSANRAVFSPIRRIFDDALLRGESRGINPDLLTGAFIALTDGFAQATQSNFGTMSQQEMAAQMISVLVDGLRPRPELVIEGDRNYAS
jgi:AcrR family transcriptional regulator